MDARVDGACRWSSSSLSGAKYGVLASLSVSMSEFKKNPAAVLREFRNRPASYIIEPQLFEAMMDELADSELYRKTVDRLAHKARAADVSLDQL